jgi:hypothetical protein
VVVTHSCRLNTSKFSNNWRQTSHWKQVLRLASAMFVTWLTPFYSAHPTSRRGAAGVDQNSVRVNVLLYWIRRTLFGVLGTYTECRIKYSEVVRNRSYFGEYHVHTVAGKWLPRLFYCLLRHGDTALYLYGTCWRYTVWGHITLLLPGSFTLLIHNAV